MGNNRCGSGVRYVKWEYLLNSPILTEAGGSGQKTGSKGPSTSLLPAFGMAEADPDGVVRVQRDRTKRHCGERLLLIGVIVYFAVVSSRDLAGSSPQDVIQVIERHVPLVQNAPGR